MTERPAVVPTYPGAALARATGPTERQIRSVLAAHEAGLLASERQELDDEIAAVQQENAPTAAAAVNTLIAALGAFQRRISSLRRDLERQRASHALNLVIATLQDYYSAFSAYERILSATSGAGATSWEHPADAFLRNTQRDGIRARAALGCRNFCGVLF